MITETHKLSCFFFTNISVGMYAITKNNSTHLSTPNFVDHCLHVLSSFVSNHFQGALICIAEDYHTIEMLKISAN